MDNDDSDDCLTDLGFMFDSYHSRDTKKISFEKFDISLHLIDEDPGHVQSGQHLWPGAFYLSSYLCKLWRQEDRLLESSVYIVELGAGCGLCGLVCAKLLELSMSEGRRIPIDGAKIVLTDYDPGSLSLLTENIELNGFTAAFGTSGGRPELLVEDLKWGNSVKALGDPENKSNAGSPLGLVVGSDLIYCDAVIQPLFTTVHKTLGGRGKFLLSFSFDIGNGGRAEIDRVLKTFGMTKRVLDVSNERNPDGSISNNSALSAEGDEETYSAMIMEFSYSQTSS